MKKTMKWISVLTLLLMILSCNNNNKVNYFPTEGWQTASPESQGIDSEKLLQAIRPLVTDPAANLHSLIIIKNGYIIAEYYSPLHNENTLHNLHSATKSFTSTLIGTAVNQKKLKLDDKVLSFFPDQKFDNMNEYKEEMTVRHLLMMGSGIDWAEWFMGGMVGDDFWTEMLNSADWNKFILDRKVITKPGLLFNYNSGNSHLLSTILSKVSGQSGSDYAQENLFKPLGINNYIWAEDSQGVPAGGIGLQLSPRDMAKLGLLYLNNGVWEGERLLSKEWIKEATSNYYPEGEIWYGYQFWLDENSFFARGYGEQKIFVLPEMNEIVIATGNLDYPRQEKGYGAWKSFWSSYWAMRHSKEPLPENQEASELLKNILKGFSVENKMSTEAPAAIKSLIGKTIHLNKNQANLTSITIVKLDQNEIEIEITAVDPADETEKTAIYRAGIDNSYIDNGYQGYPLSATFHLNALRKGHYPDTTKLPLFMRGTFPDVQSLVLESMIPGSVVHSKITLKIIDDGPQVIWRNIGRTFNLKIRGKME